MNNFDSQIAWENFCDHEKIGRIYHKVCASDFEKYTNEEQVALAKYMSGNDLNNTIYIHGSVGVGKTHAGLFLIRYMQIPRNWRRFVSSPTLLTKFRQCPDQVYDTYSQVPLLMVDDLGLENAAEWEVKYYYELFDSRYEFGLKTIITSNYTKDELATKLNPQIVSRIYGTEISFASKIDMRQTQVR
jgi:DNA replication protein DnaC